MDIIGVHVQGIKMGTNRDNIPGQFRTAAYVSLLRSKLRGKGGVLVWNTFVTTTMDQVLSGDATDSSKDVQRLLSNQFKHVYTGEHGGNRVVVASDAGYPVAAGGEGGGVGGVGGVGGLGGLGGGAGVPECVGVGGLADPTLASVVSDWWSEAGFKQIHGGVGGAGGVGGGQGAAAGAMRGRVQ